MPTSRLYSRSTTAILVLGCVWALSGQSQERTAPSAAEKRATLDARIREILSGQNVKTAGVGLIENGALAWAGYYGEQSPGTPASSATQFDTGSITKVVSTETVLRLSHDGRLNLDEPMGDLWVDPDLLSDPRALRITPRMVLTHTTGFPSRRSRTADGTLQFLADPGTAFGYSGEGFEYLMRYVEAKLDTSFTELVQAEVFEPMGITDASFAYSKDNFVNVALSVDNDTGEFRTDWGYHCLVISNRCPEDGTYSTSRNMTMTVESLAKFAISVVNADGYSAALATDRNTVQSIKDRPLFFCDTPGVDGCPLEQGYGLGWEVLNYGDNQLIAHGGHDYSVLTVLGINTETRDGVIVLLNAPELAALRVMPDILEALDSSTPLSQQYRGWLRYKESRLQTDKH
ncbi:MAG: serine hydrolase [Pseudomonadota bacterium]